MREREKKKKRERERELELERLRERENKKESECVRETGVKFIEPFYSSLTPESNKLECLSPNKLILYLQSGPGAYP